MTATARPIQDTPTRPLQKSLHVGIAAIVLGFLSAGSAWACSNPAGDEGNIIYNQTYKLMQFCDGTNWISMAGSIASGGGALTDGDKGDVSVSGVGATWSIDDGAVTLMKLQNIDTATILGRSSAGSGIIEELTIGAGLSLSGGELSATGTGLSDGDKGDVTVSGSGGTWTVDNTAVSFAKIQDVATGTLIGRSAAGAGSLEELTIGSGLELASGTLSVTAGGVPAGTVAGAVQFRGTTAVFNADDANFIWDDTNKRLGVGIATPTEALDVQGSAAANRVKFKPVAG